MELRDEIVGVIDRIVFKSPESGFNVFQLKVTDGTTITVRGFTGQLHEGSRVVVRGSWTVHPKFGKQLEATDCVAQMPTSASGILKYLSSGVIKGVGPKVAEKLVSAFGENTLEIIDKEPARLLALDGIGPRKVESIINAWQDQKQIARVMLFLRSKDVSVAYANKIYKTYGNKAIELMQENPYRLVDDIWGVGFKTADQIALKLGLDLFSMARIKAGLLYVVGQATEQGSLYIELDEMKVKAYEALGIQAAEHAPLVKQALTELYQADKVKLLSYESKHYLALPKYYFSEIGIARRIKRLQERKTKFEHLNFQDLYNKLATNHNSKIELNEHQQRGILMCLQNKISIITGGPGTGKTTLVKNLIQLAADNHIKFKLAAPTGRAAKRMSESTGRYAETLHRLLEFQAGEVGFARNEHNALELDLLIVDEASMIDVFLMHSIVKALPLDASLVLIGDVDQLPSVGAGNILRDLIDSQKVPVVRLTHIFRQAQDSMIVTNAHRVNHGDFPQSPTAGSKRDFAFVKQESPEDVIAYLKLFYTQKIKQLGISPNDSIVLVPMNRGTVGTARLNQELQQILNPNRADYEQVIVFGTAYKVGDRVMQIRNNYDKAVFNGDIGSIASLSRDDQKLVVSYPEKDVEYDFAELNELVLSYAVSIHKSQGSEFSAVIIPIFMQHFMLLQRNLIYTAITRAKKYCVLLGQSKAIGMGVRNNKGVERLTFLKQYLTTDLEAR